MQVKIKNLDSVTGNILLSKRSVGDSNSSRGAMYNLFLDDSRAAHEPANYMPSKVRFMYLAVDWVIAKTHKEFVAIITERGLPNLISFDHDLADEHSL